MFNCFRNSDSSPDPTGRTTPNSADLPESWIRYYNEEGAQLFYNRDSQLISYLNPTTLKQVQADGKTGRDAVIQMKAKTGEIYGVDYSCVPEWKIVYMPLELRKQSDKKENEKGFVRASSGWGGLAFCTFIKKRRHLISLIQSMLRILTSLGHRSGWLRLYSGSAQVKAAAIHVHRLKWNQRKKTLT